MEASDADDKHGNLGKIEHIVVLMMENRSFDHMLGYLRLEGVIPTLEGLQAGMGNEGPDGVFHEVEPLGARLISEKVLDPGHGEDDVAIQLEGKNGGFVKSYAQALEKNKKHYPYPPDLEFDPTLVLGYQRADDVPVYDYLARNWLVCDHWFSSVPGPTWENRLYAVTGGLGPRAAPEILGQVPAFLKDAPLYDRPAFVRWLDEDVWRWYSHDPGTLRLVDSRYRPGGEKGAGSDDNFSYFDRRTLFERRSFLDDAAAGKLPPVSWVDPNFVDFRLYGPPGSNDDHPPSRVMLGQELVLSLVVAVMESPQWPKTLLLITYDEHGGFFDHVFPGDYPIPGDPGRSYGVRVPALVVSPYAETGVSDATFDHTSIIKTILTRFSDRAEEGLHAMGPRTEAARDLGELLTLPADRPRERAPQEDLQRLADEVATWKGKAYREHLLEAPTPGERVFEAVSDLQRDIIGNAIALRQDGLSPGKP
jgi:phospholipase C